MEMEENLREEKSMHVVDTLMVSRLDKPFKNVEEISNWMADIENLFGTLISDKQYRELLSYALSNKYVSDLDEE